jgi:muramoyltetrapeptide carboxypeptidase LdcA involved in peptidoglycan recycling
MYELGLKRVREVFNLNHTDYPATAKLGATAAERTADLITAFTDPNVKAVIASLGGDDQITYIKNPPHRALHTKPKTICKILHLTKPQYAQLSQWGHFGHGNIWDKPF